MSEVPSCGWCRRPPADRLTCDADPCGRDDLLLGVVPADTIVPPDLTDTFRNDDA